MCDIYTLPSPPPRLAESLIHLCKPEDAAHRRQRTGSRVHGMLMNGESEVFSADEDIRSSSLGLLIRVLGYITLCLGDQ